MAYVLVGLCSTLVGAALGYAFRGREVKALREVSALVSSGASQAVNKVKSML